MGSDLIERSEYAKFLDELKERIRNAQTRAILTINKELISLYRDIGKRIVETQEAFDLRREFPDVKGFSARNLWNMRNFYMTYKDDSNLRQLVAEIEGGGRG